MQVKIILLDGSAFLFRSYFATLNQNLSNDEGFPTGAIFGVINSIKMLQNQYHDANIIAIFDHKGSNFRHKIYPEYKANRKPVDAELVLQIEPLYEIIKAMGLPFICEAQVESDDVIASLAKQVKKLNIDSIIASSDKDLYQLIGGCVYQLDMKYKLLDTQAIYDKLGVYPEQVLDFLALSGDSGDNIPGIPSVGPKTASAWIKKYQNIVNIKANCNDIKGKVGEKLRDNFALLDLSYKLVSLKDDLKLNINFYDCKSKPNNAKLAKLYKKYGFNQWLKQINALESVNSYDNNNNSLLSKYQQKLITKKEQLDKLIIDIYNIKEFVFDSETTSLNYMDAKLVGLVFLLDKIAFYLPVAHNYLGAIKQLDITMVLTKLKPIFTNKNIKKIGQNLKYDSHILANYNIELNGITDDTMLKSYCLNSTASLHNMDDLASFYLAYKTTKFSDIAGSGKKQITFDNIDIEKAHSYACEDVIITKELNNVLTEKIQKYPLLLKLYQNLELPLIKTLVNIERNGVLIDKNILLQQQKKILQDIEKLIQQAFRIAKTNFNLDSPKQLREVLFTSEYLNLSPGKTTAKGQASTNEEALKKLQHPIAKILLQYRMLSKLNSTYLKALPKQINITTNRVHTSYHQSSTATGRLSSTNPNLQNIPIRNEDGAKIRSAFIASKGFVILAADYSQIELRIMAHLSQDEGLLSAFLNNIDVHIATAAQMFAIKESEVSKTNRRDAKAINFGLMYGMGAFGLAKQIQSSNTQAKKYITTYFAKYPKVAQYINNIQELAKQQGFVETITGRRLYLADINSKNRVRQQHALRLAINAPMQGSSADIIKKSMLDIDNFIGKNNKDIKMLMQVHDELVFEVAIAKLDYYKTKINKLMSSVVSLSVPLIVDIGIGSNWQEAH